MASKKDQPMLDPIAYRDDYSEEDILWAEKPNEAFSSYWDDSDLAHQKESLWWMNDKYGWEWIWVVNYDKNATLDTLPNYIYWKEANQTWEEWYLTKRNDTVASALYNAWKVTKEDIANYLSQQQWWMNSSGMDRANTIEAIWKRIGNIQGSTDKKMDIDTSKMQEDLNQWTAWTIYGKTTAYEWDPTEWIETLEDKNSVFQMMNEARIASVEEMLNMWVDNLAAMQYSWTNPYNETNWRDFRKYYPDMAAQVDQKVKELNWQAAINAITKWNTNYTDNEIASKEKSAESSKTAMAETYANSKEEAESIKQDINNAMANNPSAVTAEDTMANITDEINKLNTRLKNLKNEANKLFKWDVPDYIVNAYINNRTQEINDRLTELKNDYNAAYQRNQTEMDNYWKWLSYWLQVDQLNFQKEQEWFDQWYKKQTLKKSNIYTDKNGVSWELKESEDGSLYYEKIPVTNRKYTVAERNNNPTNMTVDFLKIMWAEKWVDYEVSSDYFINWNNAKQYYWKLIGDPVETTIRILDRAIANWMNPFTTKSRSYINKLWLTKEKWSSMSHSQKVDMIKKWLPYEWWDMSNMLYYINWDTWISNNTSIDVNSIEIPYSVYDNWYMSVDPNSELGKQLRQDYIDNYIKENWLTAETENRNVPMTTVTLDSWESYQIPTSYYRYIYWPIPSRQKDSDLDNQRILEQILDLYNNWLSVTDALLTFNGINLNSDYADKARALFWHVMASGKDPAEWLNSSIAYNLTEGNDWLAVAAVENFVLPDEQKKEIVRITALAEKISDFIELTNNSEYSKYFWPYDSPVNTWLWKKVWNEKATKAYADLWNIYADIRQQLMGSAVTEHEAEIYDPILAQSSDNLNTVIQKLRSTLQWQMAMYNAIRWQYWLPRLDMYSDDFMNQVLYPDSRVGLYIDNNY